MTIYEAEKKSNGRVYWVLAINEAEAIAKLGGGREAWGKLSALATDDPTKETEGENGTEN